MSNRIVAFPTPASNGTAAAGTREEIVAIDDERLAALDEAAHRLIQAGHAMLRLSELERASLLRPRGAT